MTCPGCGSVMVEASEFTAKDIVVEITLVCTMCGKYAFTAILIPIDPEVARKRCSDE